MKTNRIMIAAIAAMLMAACGENTKINIGYDHPERYSIGDATLQRPISAISVDWVCGNVDILYTDDTAVRIHEEVQEGFSPLTDSLRLRYMVDDDGELEIEYCGPYKYRYGDLRNLRKHLYIEVPRGMALENIDIDGVETDVVIANVVSRELTVDGVKINFNADYPDALPDEIDIDGVRCLLALHVVPATAGLSIEMSGLKPHLACDLPSRKEGENTIVGDGRCQVEADGVEVKLSIRELK